jgi:Cof subfamily protein (haloacid dehalogenase superfamily)
VIGLLALDVDGTLLDSAGRLPEANLAAIRAAAARGVRVAVVTGRSLPFALPAVTALPDPLVLVVHNGAVTRSRDGALLDRSLLPRERVVELLVAMRPWRAHTTVMFDRGGGQTLYDRMSWDHPNRRGYHDRQRDYISAVEDLEHHVDEPPIQVAFNGGVAEMHEVLAALRALPFAAELAVSFTEYVERDFTLVDVNAAGATKGAALARLAARLDVPRAQVLAIGDNHNDVDMLQWAGVGVLMANAAPELHALGFATTASHDDAGVARAVERYVLGAPGG